MAKSLDDLYWKSFHRNYVDEGCGILTKEEQQKLRDSCVAVAGVGGIGGNQAVAIARLGIGNMKICDVEEYSESDINRMYGAYSSTVGKKKVKVMEEIIKDINPSINIKSYENGITLDNTEDFLEDTDIAVDAIEYFTLEEKLKFNKTAREKNLYVLTSPIPAYGTVMLVFDPKGMTFEEYLEIPEKKEKIKDYVMPVKKICPKMPEYLPENFYKKALKKGVPFSTLGSSAMLSGALVANEVMSILLDKRDPVCIPECTSIDMYERRFEIL